MGKYPRTTARRRQLLPEPKQPAVLLSGLAPEEQRCEYARTFAQFTDALLATLANASQSLHVNRAKVLLTDQYFRFRRTLPREHQDTAAYNGHVCVAAVFAGAYDALEQVALRIAPPAFELPPRPATRGKKKEQPLPDLWDEDTIHRMVFGDGRT